MKALYRSLRENDRRCYAAAEVAKLGHGGLEYICSVLGCDPKTVRQGQQDLQELTDQDPDDIVPSTAGQGQQERQELTDQDPDDFVPSQRVRRPGGGRKPHLDKIPDLRRELHSVLENHTAGSPMKQEVVWTDLTPKEIQAALDE